MYKIVEKQVLNPEVTMMRVEAPLIAKKVKPGQFVILRVEEGGERIPLTVADSDAEQGLVTIIFQIVGYTTERLSRLEEGAALLDFVGPLGEATALADIKRACVIGGGLGVAIAYPQAKALYRQGAVVDVITGFRNKELVILEKDFSAVSHRLYVCTDDGSYGDKGFVSQKLEKLLSSGAVYDTVIAIGPLMMMKAVCDITEGYGIKTIVSMNSIMLDGTGMCGACRLTVGGETKFACVDGPDFDGHQVDFGEALNRSRMYREEELISMEHHHCHLLGGRK